ncbi:molybdopterin-guanine dinucleotide biosynthesis protein B [Candidatus Latescibacterota bacterium]
MIAKLPIFGICGLSNSGKTTLIEELIPHLSQRDLTVAVVKITHHTFDSDRTGKDSDRFFRAGCDVMLQGPQEVFFRAHYPCHIPVKSSLVSLAKRYDLVFVEGGKHLPITKVWLTKNDGEIPSPDIENIAEVIPRNSDRAATVMSILDRWLHRQWMKTPVYGCVLIGGSSSRMGTPKHLLVDNGKTWLERTTGLLRQFTDTVIISGTGDIPQGLNNCIRLPDVPGIKGPMAGILSVMRWATYTSWIVTACDLPGLSVEALNWLMSTRKPGVWATMPKVKGRGNVEPLLALYDFRAHGLLESVLSTAHARPSHIANHPKVLAAAPPKHLEAAWDNVNTTDELRKRSNHDTS